MLFIFGIKTSRVGRYTDHEHICYPCRSFDREINVYRNYVHFCLIPVFPVGKKQVDMRCRNCGDETKLDTVLNQYGNQAGTPFYFYSAPVLALAIGLYWVYWNHHASQRAAQMLASPAIGDVYTIHEEKNNETNYSFIKIVNIEKDSVSTLHNHLYYGDFVSDFSTDDYFVKEDTTRMSKKDLKDMLESKEIYSVIRDYGKSSDFNLVK